ncbi:MAG: DUF58 domain-containing protein [Gemmatimonadaceae bacterium]|nr:DUF58 domain-containing protein [Gemmatimonadaceae bacterium]
MSARELLAKIGRSVVSVIPTRRLVLIVAASAPVWLISVTAGVVVTVMLAVAIIVDMLLLPARWQVVTERIVRSNVGLGDAERGEYRVRSTARRALRFTLFDALPHVLESPETRGAIHAVAANEETVIPFTFVARERGSWALGPVVVRVQGALGLVQHSLRYEPGDMIVVTPSLAGVRNLRLLAIQHRLRDAGIRSIRKRGEGSSFASLREYSVGDDPRHVDWKATARRQKIMTREYTVEQGQTVMIAVDAGRMMTQLASGVPRFEYALSAATLLASVAVQAGDQVGLLLFDNELRAFVPPARGGKAMRGIRQALIPARATMTEPDYATAFRTLATRHRKRSLIVLFTDVIDPRSSQAVIAHTVRSALRHLLVVVALRNDELVSAAIPTSHSTSSDLYGSAAAEELLGARNEAIVRMRRAGVSVLDVSPKQLASSVVNHYLELKARGSV